MELRTCEFCGTEYDKTFGKCPLCGKSNGNLAETVPARKAVPTAAEAMQAEGAGRRTSHGGGARLAPKGSRGKQSIPNKGLWAVICILLGAAVVAGLLYFVSIMGYFTTDETVIQEPSELPEYNYENQEPSVPVDGMEKEDTEEEELPTQEEIPGVIACTGLTISQDEVTIDELGGRLFLTAVARPSDCEQPIVYTSSDDAIVTVDENGLITAMGPGEAQIIVSCGSQVKFCLVHCDFVVEEPEQEESEEDEETEADEEQEDEETTEDEQTTDAKPVLSKNDMTLFYPGEEATLTVKNVPNGTAVTYTSSNAAVASVSNAGKVKAVGNGTATITVTVGDVKLSCVVRCNLESTTEGGTTGNVVGPFSVSTEYGKLGKNESGNFDVTLSRSGETCTLILKDANGNKVTGVNWATSNGGVCSVAANGKLTAVGSGQATVSVTYGGETIKVTVRCNF